MSGQKKEPLSPEELEELTRRAKELVKRLMRRRGVSDEEALLGLAPRSEPYRAIGPKGRCPTCKRHIRLCDLPPPLEICLDCLQEVSKEGRLWGSDS
jgi:hypothetical protein